MRSASIRILAWLPLAVALVMVFSGGRAGATPANRTALEGHFDRFLSRDLARCTTCHLPSDKKNPESLEEFPHNPFGNRLRLLGEEWRAAGKKKDIPARLVAVAQEDSDGDGVPNETELLLGHNPGDAKDVPTPRDLALGKIREKEFASFLTSYRWQPFEPVRRPPVPPGEFKNPVDAFLAAEWKARGLRPRPEASREVLLRRAYLDLIGLNPTPQEQDAYREDKSSGAYERLVDRLLADPRHGERWGRHWMDVWRYSDWAGWEDGKQVRDSKPHIWRWRDWIVESLNSDKPYDRMIVEMLAADEATPGDTNALRATGFLVRNYKLLSREQWLEDTVKHTSQAFLGLTMGCAKCHDHMYDPVSQREYYQMRAIFEPYNVRTDRIPGELDTLKDGLVRAYDATNAPTFLFVRGDERNPLTNEVIQPGVPSALGGKLAISEVTLPDLASRPDRRAFVVEEQIAASAHALESARATWQKAHSATNPTPAIVREAELAVEVAEWKHQTLLALVAMEKLPTPQPGAATNAAFMQRQIKVAEARLKQHQAQTALAEAQRKAEESAASLATASADDKTARDGAGKSAAALGEAGKKATEATQQFSDALAALAKPRDPAFKPRDQENFPATSTGRRLAFANWVVDGGNPLTARVAVNHLWQHHFGRGLVSSPADFGRNGRTPTHPQLMDWLASEFTTRGWSLRQMHRTIMTSAAYKMASTPDEADAAIDPDNLYLWRMNSRRMEAECVRDNLLQVAGNLESSFGGPDIDCKLALTSNRRSIYLRHAAEKQAEFLQIFDGASVTECYERHPSVMPQQALAMANSEITLRQAKSLAAKLGREGNGDEAALVTMAYQRILARAPLKTELTECLKFLDATKVSDSNESSASERRIENLVLVLLNHNDFITVR